MITAQEEVSEEALVMVLCLRVWGSRSYIRGTPEKQPKQNPGFLSQEEKSYCLVAKLTDLKSQQ